MAEAELGREKNEKYEEYAVSASRKCASFHPPTFCGSNHKIKQGGHKWVKNARANIVDGENAIRRDFSIKRFYSFLGGCFSKGLNHPNPFNRIQLLVHNLAADR